MLELELCIVTGAYARRIVIWFIFLAFEIWGSATTLSFWWKLKKLQLSVTVTALHLFAVTWLLFHLLRLPTTANRLKKENHSLGKWHIIQHHIFEVCFIPLLHIFRYSDSKITVPLFILKNIFLCHSSSLKYMEEVFLAYHSLTTCNTLMLFSCKGYCKTSGIIWTYRNSFADLLFQC